MNNTTSNPKSFLKKVLNAILNKGVHLSSLTGCFHAPGKKPVALGQIDTLPFLSAVAYNGDIIDYKFVVDNNDMSAAYIIIKSEKEIPPHTHSLDTAYYFYKGQFMVWVNNEMAPAGAGDSLYIPEGSVTKIDNAGEEDSEVFMFFPDGPIEKLTFQPPGEQNSDNEGTRNKLVKPSHASKEYWNGKLPAGGAAPVWWQNHIDTNSMVLGVTNIGQYYDVTSHYHEQTELVIFASGNGITRINSKEYAPINRFSFIHPPNWSIHHTISLGEKPLREIYFFPSGPFSTIKYIYEYGLIYA